MTLRLATLAAAALTLSGCGGTVQSFFGLDRNPPDEFRVVQRAPLEVPNQFTLPPPQPGAVRPQEGTAADQAAAVVFGAARQQTASADATPAIGQAAAAQAGFQALRGAGAGRPAAKSAAEGALLARAGAQRADPSVRAAVNAEAQAEIDSGKTWLDTILWWRKPQEPGTVVEPTLEAQRLRGASASGAPVTEGDTPQVLRRRRAPLEGLF